MNKKFLDKVLDQIVSETKIDHDKKKIFFSFFSFSFSSSLLLILFPFFSKHCRNVYGLNDDEVEYVWKEYRNIIIYKING